VIDDYHLRQIGMTTPPQIVPKPTLPPNPADIFRSKGENWYLESRFFWSIQEPSVESMAQGVNELSTADLRFTHAFISLLRSEDRIRGGRVADCGGGIGRVSLQVLGHFFQKIDIIDPIPHFLLKAREHIEKDLPLETYQVGLEEWTPAVNYDAYFIQWTLCHLTDTDLVAFLRRCREHLEPTGVLLVKENISGLTLTCDRSEYEFYTEKNSICRTFQHFSDLFREAGFYLEEYKIQPNWPKEFLTVVFFVLR
jgi:protein N-terminal methyltransferase